MQTTPLHREVCCISGAWVRDMKRKLPTLMQPSDYYPLLISQVGSDEVPASPRTIKRDFRALVKQVKGSGAQVTFCSVSPVAGNGEPCNSKGKRDIDGLKTQKCLRIIT